ncbi:MAG: cytochrome c3 family protein [Desulfurivibrionaceae bacterium]
MRYSDFRTFLLIAAFGSASFYPGLVQAGPYLDSAHGNSTYGVSRVESAAAGFARGNCTHCHEQHASAGTEQGYLIFDQNNTDQARNFCFNCHGTGSGHVINRSYSFRAGGWTTEFLDNVKDAFDPSRASSHNLADIVTFADGMVGWKYTANSNACGVCHDPHLVQGDPANYAFNQDNPKSGAARPGVVTQINSSPVNLWGDNPSTVERMSNYPSYIDPYRTVGTAFEPDGNSLQQNGANSVNYVAFCTTCHDAANVINSTDLGRQLKFIDWPLFEKHGQVVADTDIQMNGPYVSGGLSLGYVLSCLDCHEPHGSDNIYLLRGKVNGGETTTPTYFTPINSGLQFGQLCRQCHNPQPVAPGTGVDWDDVHHDNTNPAGPPPNGVDEPYDYRQAPYNAGCNNPATGCHLEASAPVSSIDCAICHYHGAQTNNGVIPATNVGVQPTRQTF